MSTFSSRIVVAFSVIALAVSAGAAAAAQARKSTDLLTSTQVKELVAAAKTPADHLKLSKHFTALAAKYEDQANEHEADPSGPGTAAHCDRFAELTRQAAKEARELASAHEHMAAAK